MAGKVWGVISARHSLLRLVSVMVMLGFVASLFAVITFERTYGGTNSDEGLEVEQTSDQGYIIAGSTRSFGAGEYDVYLIKTDSLGDTLWTKVYGGTDWDKAQSVQQTQDGGYIIGGWTQSFGNGVSDAYLIKTNASGDIVWTRTYGGTDGDDGQCVRQTSDSGYIFVGRTNSSGAGDFDVYLVKTDVSGDSMWAKTFGSAYIDFAVCVQQTSDEGYIIVGMNGSLAGGDVYLIKTDSLGDSLWTRVYGGGNSDRGYFVNLTQDGGYIITGETSSYGAGGSDVYLIKTDASGDTTWTKTYGGSASEAGVSVQQTQDGGYIITGRTQSYGAGEVDAYLIKTDSSGDTMWTRTYGGASYDWGFSAQQTLDDGYIMAGYTQSFGAGSYDFYLIKTDQNGNVGVEEESQKAVDRSVSATIVSGPLLLPEDKMCRVFDVSGRLVTPDLIMPGVYFLEIEGEITQKIVKIR